MNKYTLVFIIAIGVATSIMALKGKFHQIAEEETKSIDAAAPYHEFVIAQAHTLLGFNLVDPGQAPASIRESVLRGYRIIMNTPFLCTKLCTRSAFLHKLPFCRRGYNRRKK